MSSAQNNKLNKSGMNVSEVFTPVKLVEEMSSKVQTSKLNKAAMDAVVKCAELYGFDVSDAIEKILNSKVSKTNKKEVPKSSFALPFSNVKNDKCCEGLRYNEGLYTQCEVSKKGESKYCTVCEKGGLKYGSIDERMKCGLMEFKDPSGKSPVVYSKIMKKLKITKEDVMEEALKMGKSIDELHFEVQEEKRGRPKVSKVIIAKEEKKKGRPKKEKKSLELDNNTTDLFADLIANSCELSCEIEEDNKELLEEFPEYKAHLEGKVEVSNKDLLKEVKKQMNELKKMEKDAEKEALKLKKDAEKEAQKLKKDAEKVVTKVVKEKAVKEPKEKVPKKAPKEAKETKEKAVKEPKEKVPKKAPKEAKETKEKVPEKVIEEEEEEEDTVERITKEGVKCKKSFDGEQYLRSSKSGVVYNMEQDVIGKWDEESNKIVFNPVEAELEGDEDYESEDE
jgi:hypothetical protein